MCSNARFGRESVMARQHTSRAPARLSGRADSTGLNSNCLCERQRKFAEALLDPDRSVPRGLVGPDRQPSEKRFNVYRNNVVAGLVEALKAAFPAARRIAGDEFFAAMARVYVSLAPPRTPVMLDYGESFPDFIGTFEPAKCVAYLADVARLERAWVEAYHAAEAPPIDPSTLAAIDSQIIPHVTFALHPSVRVVRSSFPVVQIWEMNVDARMPATLNIAPGGENALVIRPVAEVEVRQVSAGAATFIQSLAAGASISDATILALDADCGFDLSGALRDLFAINAIVGWNTPERTDSVQMARYA